MKIQHGPFAFEYNKKEKPDMSTQESHIRSKTAKTEETSTDDKTEQFFHGASLLVKTYFVYKMADRVLEKVLR